MKQLKKHLFTILFLCPLTAIAITTPPILTLQNKHPQEVWILRNISKETLLIDHYPHLHAAQAGWLSKLSPDRYSALALNEKTFQITCQLYGKQSYVSCKKVLQVESMVNSASHRDIKHGTYWLAENQHWVMVWWNLRKQGFWRLA